MKKEGSRVCKRLEWREKKEPGELINSITGEWSKNLCHKSNNALMG